MTINFYQNVRYSLLRNIFFALILSFCILQPGRSLQASTSANTVGSNASEQQVIIVEECGPLTESDTLYQLTGDLTGSSDGCFSIDAPNITLDCQGHEIFSPSGAGDGVNVSGGTEGATVSNCRLNNFSSGIYVSNSPYFTADNNYIYSAGYSGIFVMNSPHSILRQNQIVEASNTAKPFFIFLSDQSVLEKNQSENNMQGISSVNSSNISILENIISCRYGNCLSIEGDYIIVNDNQVSALDSNSTDGIWLKGSHNMLEGNIVSSDFGSGIRIQGYYNRLEYNIVSTKASSGPTIGGIYIGDLTGRGTDNILTNNLVSGEFSVAFFITSARNQVTNNKAVGKSGLFINRDTDNIVTGNTIHALDPNSFAVYVAGSNQRIYNNIIVGEKWVSNTGSNLSLSYNKKGNRYMLQDGTEVSELYDLIDVTNDNQADMGTHFPLDAGNSDGRLIGQGQDFHPYTKKQNPKFSGFRLEVQADPPVGGVVTGTNLSMRYGQVGTVTATANPGYKFVSWYNGIGNCPSQPGNTRGVLYVTIDPEVSTRCYVFANFQPVN